MDYSFQQLRDTELLTNLHLMSDFWLNIINVEKIWEWICGDIVKWPCKLFKITFSYKEWITGKDKADIKLKIRKLEHKWFSF